MPGRGFAILSDKDEDVCKAAHGLALVPEALQLAEEWDPPFHESNEGAPMVSAACFLNSHPVRIGEHRQDRLGQMISTMSHQLFHAPLPLQNSPPVPCCLCRVYCPTDVLQRHRRRACLLVALPIRFLACNPAVRGLPAYRAALESRTLRATVGAALRGRRHRRGRAGRDQGQDPSHLHPQPFKIDCKNSTDQAARREGLRSKIAIPCR